LVYQQHFNISSSVEYRDKISDIISRMQYAKLLNRSGFPLSLKLFNDALYKSFSNPNDKYFNIFWLSSKEIKLLYIALLFSFRLDKPVCSFLCWTFAILLRFLFDIEDILYLNKTLFLKKKRM
ncbi:hypothetical protein CFSAN001084_20176, partial [Salmonella enterica subsp. enterica serovar Eastbourne str. CFSAN001084]